MAAALMTEKQKDVMRKLLSGEDITIRDAVAGSGFLPEAIGAYAGIPGRELRERMEAGDKVADLPITWKLKLKMAALKLGISTAAGA